MHGCKPLAISVLIIVVAGCTDTVSDPKQQVSFAQAALSDAFDEKCTGTLRGAVTWHGERPYVAPLKVLGLPGDYPVDVRGEQPNPNTPKIGSSDGIEGAVVFLRHVDTRKSKPWDHPEVRIEHHERRLTIRQGETTGRFGFIRAGNVAAAVNLDNHFHMLRGRGVDFFSLPLPRPNVSSERRLTKPGVVELSSGAFFFWMRAYLFVDVHPYYTQTDDHGNFELDQVPAGSYELVCWMPNWKVSKRPRDPDTGHVIQIEFEAPLEQSQAVDIAAGRKTQADFAMSAGTRR